MHSPSASPTAHDPHALQAVVEPARLPRRMWLINLIVGALLWLAVAAAVAATNDTILVPTLILLGTFLVPISTVLFILIERVVGCDARFAESITTPAERARVPHRSDREIVSLWSGNEALAKALGDRYDPRRLESPIGWPDGVNGAWRASALRLPDGYVGWLCWRGR